MELSVGATTKWRFIVKNLLAFLFMFIASAGASLAQAAAVAVPCNACTSAEASQVARGKGLGIHYVYDFANAALRKYEVHVERDADSGQYTTRVDELPVEPGHLNYFAKLVNARRDFGRVSRIVVPITIGPGDVSPAGTDLGGIDATDVLHIGQARNRLSDFILAQQNRIFSRSGLSSDAAEDLVDLLQSYDKVFTQGELLNVTLKVTFSDGSRITLTLGDGGTVAIVPRTARDRDNNAIPDANVADFALTFLFSSDSTRERFVAVAEQQGIVISGPAGDKRALSCSWNGTTLSCKFV
jgi:hypothetical protein